MNAIDWLASHLEPRSVVFATFALFAFGLLSLCAGIAMTLLEQQSVRALRRQVREVLAERGDLASGDPAAIGALWQELLESASWPRVLRRARAAWTDAKAICDKTGADFESMIDLESVRRSIATSVSKRGAFLKPIASTLVVLSLLATFSGMRTATRELSASIQDIGSTASDDDKKDDDQKDHDKKDVEKKDADASAAEAVDARFKSFFANVNRALGDMSGAFGVNLGGVFFGALLVLLLPLLRATQKSLIVEVQDFLDVVVRPLCGRRASWTAPFMRDLSDKLAATLEAVNTGIVHEMKATTSESSRQLLGQMQALMNVLAPLSTTLDRALERSLQSALSAHGNMQIEALRTINGTLDEVGKQYANLLAIYGEANARLEATTTTLERIADVVGATQGSIDTQASQHHAMMQALLARLDNLRPGAAVATTPPAAPSLLPPASAPRSTVYMAGAGPATHVPSAWNGNDASSRAHTLLDTGWQSPTEDENKGR